MFDLPEVLWLTTNKSFSRFEQPLVRYLSKKTTVGQWEYSQSQDEATSLNVPLVLLHDYLKCNNQKVHLIGHSTGGLLGLLYARKYPHRVKSLTLLGVGVYPQVDWQAHYYTLRQTLNCSSTIVLTQMVYNLFGYQNQCCTKKLIEVLKKDLVTSPSSHSLFKRISGTPGGVKMPLMICGSKEDVIVDSNALKGWHKYLKEGDLFWECPQGSHFFHYLYPQLVGKQFFKFWQSLDDLAFSVNLKAG